VIAGSVYTILAFIGFEAAAAPLAEEARDPRRTIRLAVIYSCLGIGLFYVLTTYAHHQGGGQAGEDQDLEQPQQRARARAQPHPEEPEDEQDHGRGHRRHHPPGVVAPADQEADGRVQARAA
jgi:hypothetical protein